VTQGYNNKKTLHEDEGVAQRQNNMKPSNEDEGVTQGYNNMETLQRGLRCGSETKQQENPPTRMKV
jgi:hypothetical protein